MAMCLRTGHVAGREAHSRIVLARWRQRATEVIGLQLQRSMVACVHTRLPPITPMFPKQHLYHFTAWTVTRELGSFEVI